MHFLNASQSLLFKLTIDWFLTDTGDSFLISLLISEVRTDPSSFSFYLIKKIFKM